MELLFEREFAASPAELWPWVTDPARMSEWSEAPLSSVTMGAGGRPDGAGAVRAVHTKVAGVELVIEEAVIESKAPERFIYRIVRGGGLRDHEGVVTLTPKGTGTRMVWRIRMGSRVPGWHRIAAFLVKRGMQRSLDKLQTLA